MKTLFKDRSFRISIILTLVFFGVGLIFLFAGLAELNFILFGVLPFALGLSIGALPNWKRAFIAVGIATACMFICVVFMGLSGLICVVMALPFVTAIVLSVAFLVAVILHLVKRYRDIRNNNRLAIHLLPLLLFMVAAPLSKQIAPVKDVVEEVRTEQIFNYTPEQVYDAIKSVDTLDAEKPYLMNFDLPVPTKCILEKEEVGALRTCYFDGGNFSSGDFGKGTIVERVTQLERGKVLKMDVIDCQIIGRKWLGFKEAIYYFEPAGTRGCKLTRITTYTSVLYPRFYWEPMERLGIEQEHQYVFNNLKKDLENTYGK
jgi:hypothetical protein